MWDGNILQALHIWQATLMSATALHDIVIIFSVWTSENMVPSLCRSKSAFEKDKKWGGHERERGGEERQAFIGQIKISQETETFLRVYANYH